MPADRTPMSFSDRSSSSGGSVTFCSSAICFIAAKIFDLTDMVHLTFRLFEPMPEPDFALNDARVDGRGRSNGSYRSPDHAGTADRPPPKDQNPLAGQPLLLLLEGVGRLERPAQPRRRPELRIRRQPTRKVFSEYSEIEIPAHHQGRHAGAAIGPGTHANPIGRGRRERRGSPLIASFTSLVATFSPFQRKVSPTRSMKCKYPARRAASRSPVRNQASPRSEDVAQNLFLWSRRASV